MATCGAGLEMAAKQLGECLKGVSDILNSNSTCVIDEESDGYGFSLIGGGRYADTDVIQSFREDANWNNPGAVGLMKRAFGITDEHDSVLLRREPIGDSFIVLRKQYNTMLAHKFFVDGKLLKDKGSLVDSCKRFDEAIRLDSADPEIFIERASVKTILGKSEDALRDYESAIQLDPANAAAQSEAHALRLSIRQTIPAVAAKATASSANIVHTPASSSSSIANAPSATNRSLIDKLQQSLGKRRKDGVDGSNDSSASDNSSSSDSQSRQSSPYSNHKKKKKKHKKDNKKDKKHKKSKRKSHKHKKDRMDG